jgi:hypothetical protein
VVRQEIVASDHILQLFDTDDSLAESVAAFLAAGDALGQTLLVVCTVAHWEMIVQTLATTPCDPERARAEGRLHVLDAEELLSRFMRRGEPNRTLFEQNVVAAVGRLAAESRGKLRIYGEMVELLVREGNYAAAARLEKLWNQLAEKHRFTLLCGYAAAHFAGPDAGSALTAICSLHTAALAQASDPLGQFLLTAKRSSAGADAI